MKKTTTFPNWKKTVLSLMALTLFFSFSNAQNAIQFQGETLEIQDNIDSFQWEQMPESSKLANGYFGWIQFYETPTQDIQDAFKANNLELLDYIPHQTYLFYFPETASIQFLKDSGVRAIVPVQGRFKLSSNLRNGIIGDWAVSGNNILVTLVHHENVNTNFVINELATRQISLVKQYAGASELELSIPDNCLEDLSNLPYVKWIDVTYAPSIPDDRRGRSLHRSNGLDTQTGAGRNYTGDGIGVLCRDDGPVGPHVDFEGRHSGLYGNNGNNTHGDGVSGIMAGAGNKDPNKRGMAAGSDLHIVNYVPSFLDAATVSLLNDGSVQVTNSSHSNGCNAGYTSSTRNVDEQMHDLENILHVFSAGNSNGSNCGYGAGSQWGNITGGHKQGKNVIATANTLFDGNIVGSSSRGPAHDGRIKPDIAANGQQTSTAPNHGYMGFGGTSGASPGIAGVSAQLFEVYADDNGGALPKGALIKAALLNTTNEAGNIGPDFIFGWGIVNGLRAGKLIEDGRYLSDDISQGGSNTHNITVPSGTTQMRVMIHWSDPEAAIGASPALVNDLDLLVTDPSNNDYEPWILDSTPDPTLLNLPATNGPDHLNNVEQVLINNPAAGSYDINISGFNVPMGPQEYFVVYEFITENLVVTYPNSGSEKFFSAGSLLNVIHWDAINTTAPFLVEYTIDNGGTWTTIATVPADEYLLSWQAPGVFTGEAKIRVTSGAFSDESDEPFSIIERRVTGQAITKVCETEASFSWNSLAETESYDLWMMGEKYMEVVGNTTDTSITVPIADADADLWYAIAPRNDTDGWVGLRSIASVHTTGILDCILGLDDNDLTNSVILYPNPASNEFTINLGSSITSEVEITVTNSLGQTIQKLSTSATQTRVNVSNYHTGIYFVSIKTDTQATTKKLLIK
ncbi:MAG: S8 family serine peptidase [Flavobacteriaceae bacterium]|nr:S8 family serine peptidase [Flavobacteriaceae bacterium]